MRKGWIFIWAFLVFLPLVSPAQERRVKRTDKSEKRESDGGFMQYFIDEKGDTVYMDNMEPAVVTAKRKGKEWRKYYRLVYNFAKAYPYALVAKEIMMEADSTISYDNMNRRERERYIKKLQGVLFDTFEKPLKNLTISQGKLLLRLIDREIGVTPYEIIRNYKSKAAAGFWQGVARLFGSNMKLPYDPDGEDKQTEELVEAYQKGEFAAIYRSIYGNEPPEPVVRAKNDFEQR